MPALVHHGFSGLDWLILAGYFALLIALGAALSRRQSGTDDYFLAGRRMPAWAVALSVVATAISAATFIGGPYQAYAGDLTYLSATIGQFIAILIVAAFFIPTYYRLSVTTVYDLVGTRFGPAAKQACSWMFMLGRIFANGARLYIAALAGSQLLFSDTSPAHLAIGIAALTAVGVAYTLVGGIRAIIWIEVVQTIVLVGAALAAIAVLLHRIPLSTSDIIHTLATAQTKTGSKLDTLRLGLTPSGPDWRQSYTLLTALLCWPIFNLAAYGTDHDLAQRMLTCRTAVKGAQSAIGAILIGLPITALFMAIGLLLHIFYDRPDLMGPASPGPRPGDAADVFIQFILTQMPTGLAGLMMAGMFAAALSSLSSALNAMSATLVNDVVRRHAPDHSERTYLRTGRAAMILWGAILGLFACLCIYWQRSNSSSGQTLIDFALGVMNFAYAGLAAVFCTAIFTRRGSSASAIASLAVGFIIVLAGQPAVWKWWTDTFDGWTFYTPNSATVHRMLPETPPAFPWVLLVAFLAALITCCLGRRPNHINSSARSSP